MKKRHNEKKHNEKSIILILLISVAFLTIGYSAHSTELDIDGMIALIRIEKDIRITNISLANTTSNASSNLEEYNVSSISSEINLPNANSTITYNIKIVNIGNMEAAISEINNLPNNLTYSISNYNIGEMLCDDNDSTKCKLGSTTTLAVTIKYAKNGYNSSNTNYSLTMNFKFNYMVDAIAMIENKLYNTLQEAIDDVANDTQTTVILLNNTSEAITVGSKKNIIFDFKNNTLSNNGNNPVINNNGTISISNGTISSNASTNGAINNQSTGKITISGGRVIVTGGRQALYNNKGTATITGTAYLTSVGTERATVQNLSGGTLTISGGTIISSGSSGVNNAGTMNIGVKDNNIDTSIPMIQGIDYGITSSTKYNIYDGIFKGRTRGINDDSKVNETDNNYGLITAEETIDNLLYKTSYLGLSIKITFNPNGGTVSETSKFIEVGTKIGELPTPIRSGYIFDGWYTTSNGGTKISSETTADADTTFYAHWTKTQNIAQIGERLYDTIQEAINAVPNNTETTITLLEDIGENVTISGGGKNIIFDLNNKTLSNVGNNAVITNTNANIKIINGKITSNADTAAINMNSGTLTISSGEIIATGTRQTIYITGGTVTITGSTYLSSQTSGTPTGTSMERGTVQCLANGKLIITGGTIVGEQQQAVSNEGTLTIGTKDGIIDTTTPILIGKIHGVKSSGTFNFYDGIIKGKTDAINGTITEQEDNTQILSGVETINGNNYITKILETTE